MRPAIGPDADRVKAGPRPVQPALFTQAVEYRLVQLVEDAGVGPLVPASPAGPARPVAELAGQLGPTDPGENTKAMPSNTSRSRVRGRQVRPCTAGLRSGISGSTSAHNSSLFSRGGGEATGKAMPRTLRRPFDVGHSPTTHFRNVS